MKVLLALSLLLFLDFVFSQEGYISCTRSKTCPEGFSRYPTEVGCLCKPDSSCSLAANFCKNKFDPTCSNMERNCSPKEILDACNDGYFGFPERCDNASQRFRKEKYAKTQQACETSKKECRTRGYTPCDAVQSQCEPDATIQLCKDRYISTRKDCEAAEIKKEKERAEDTKYTCADVQKNCLTNINLDVCSTITKICDVDTAAKWCLKYDTKQIKKMSDEDCSKVIKKNQDLMFGKNKDECWKQVPQCERGDSEACKQVPTLCVKEIVSALCNAKRIKNERICTLAGLENKTGSSYPQCNFFADKCVSQEGDYCSLASRYCDNDTIDNLCRKLKITDLSICKRVNFGISDPLGIVGTIRVPNIFGL